MTRMEGLEPCKKEPVTCKNGAATDKDEREMSKERPSHAKKRRATRKRSPGKRDVRWILTGEVLPNYESTAPSSN